jgi:hypothetical protein
MLAATVFCLLVLKISESLPNETLSDGPDVDSMKPWEKAKAVDLDHASPHPGYLMHIQWSTECPKSPRVA